MNCEQYEPALGDYVDGTIGVAAANALGVHLAGCDRCRALADDLRAIRGAARMLERHEPPARTWNRIAAAVESRVEADRSVKGFAWFPWRPLAVAAAVLLMSAATWWMLRPGTQGVPVETPQAAAEPSSFEFDMQSAEDHYQSAIAGLEQITKAGGGELDPQTAEVLKVNLTIIDTAIGESRAALRTEPSSDVAQESLFAALSSKLALLQDTVALINEMRKGNQEGAARIVSGLNQ